MRAARNPNHAIAAAVSAVALLAFGGTFFFDPVPPGLPGLGAVEFPRLVCLAILALAGLLALQQGRPPTAEEAPAPDRGAWAILAACLLFLPAMEVLGLWPVMAGFLVVAGRAWGGVGLRLLVINAVALTAVIWLVFVRIFRLTLPSGWLGAALGY